MRDPGPADPPDRRPALADDPASRGRLTRASAELMAALLAAISVLTALVLWHLARRGRLIRERLGSPRQVRWPDRAEGPDRTEGPDRIEGPDRTEEP